MIVLSDEEYKQLVKIKGNRTWKQLLLDSIPRNREEILKSIINRFVRELQREDPRNYEIYELVRVALIQMIKGNIQASISLFNRCLEILEET